MQPGSRYRLDRDSAQDIVNERRYQILAGHDVAQDDSHVAGELLLAALAYMCSPGEGLWPWLNAFHPSTDPIDNLIAAGGLISAEADRLKRCRLAGRPVEGGFVVLAMEPEEILEIVDGSLEMIREMSELGKEGS